MQCGNQHGEWSAFIGALSPDRVLLENLGKYWGTQEIEKQTLALAQKPSDEQNKRKSFQYIASPGVLGRPE